MTEIKEESQRSSFSATEDLNYKNAKKMIGQRYSSSNSIHIGGAASSTSLARSIKESSGDDGEYQFDINQNSMNTLNASTLTFNPNDSTQNFNDSTQFFSDSPDSKKSNDGTRKLKTGEDKIKTKNNE